jgi:1-acyl-sn-glycerol-3-phosphate acyltransferase
MDEYRAPLRFRLSRPVLRTVFRGIFRILGRVKITGRENVPFGRPYVVAINHVSIFDPPFAASFGLRRWRLSAHRMCSTNPDRDNCSSGTA